MIRSLSLTSLFLTLGVLCSSSLGVTVTVSVAATSSISSFAMNPAESANEILETPSDRYLELIAQKQQYEAEHPDEKAKNKHQHQHSKRSPSKSNSHSRKHSGRHSTAIHHSQSRSRSHSQSESKRKLELLKQTENVIEKIEKVLLENEDEDFLVDNSSEASEWYGVESDGEGEEGAAMEEGEEEEDSASLDSALISDLSIKGLVQKIKSKATPSVGKVGGADYSNWMRDNMNIIGSRTLANLVLPGTHDSGTYNLGSSLANDPNTPADLTKWINLANKFHIPVSDLINPWAKAQDQTLYQQAASGSRYFDIRAGYQNNQWNCYHFNLATPVSTVLNDLGQYLRDHPSEIMWVEVSHFFGSDANSLNQLVGIIQSAFGNLLAPRSIGFGQTVTQLITANHRAFVTFDNNGVVDNQPNLWYSYTIYNTYANADTVSSMTTYNDQQVAKFNSQPLNGQIYKLSWTLTAQTSDILDTFLPWDPHNLFALADKANPSLFNWGTAYLNKGKKIGGIIIIDHFENSQIVQLTIEANKH